jgi:transcriptional regulator with XRE-family HTH domain
MVNSEEFSKRLTILMDYYMISAAQMAEKIDVQRSSISHILSGRNKPSLDFVLKILNAFPEVELYWLLNGVGNFPKKTSEIKNTPTSVVEEKKQIANTPVVQEKLNFDSPSEIERIVIFYKDGTFKNYNP